MADITKNISSQAQLSDYAGWKIAFEEALNCIDYILGIHTLPPLSGTKYIATDEQTAPPLEVVNGVLDEHFRNLEDILNCIRAQHGLTQYSWPYRGTYAIYERLTDLRQKIENTADWFNGALKNPVNTNWNTKGQTTIEDPPGSTPKTTKEIWLDDINELRDAINKLVDTYGPSVLSSNLQLQDEAGWKVGEKQESIAGDLQLQDNAGWNPAEVSKNIGDSQSFSTSASTWREG